MNESDTALPKRAFRRKNYLSYPRIQIELVGFVISLFVITLGILYVSLTKSLSRMNAEMINWDSAHAQGLRVFVEQQRHMVRDFFGAFLVISVIVAMIGGILLSHRVLGPVTRIKIILKQMIDGQHPVPLDCRKTDMLHDVFILLQEVVKKFEEKR